MEEIIEKACKELDLKWKKKEKKFEIHVIEKTTVTVEREDNNITLFANIMECPREKREDIFVHLMKGNFLGKGTGGAAAGLDKDEKNLTLLLTLPYEIGSQQFKAVIEDFINYIFFWREQIEKLYNKLTEKNA